MKKKYLLLDIHSNIPSKVYNCTEKNQKKKLKGKLLVLFKFLIFYFNIR